MITEKPSYIIFAFVVGIFTMIIGILTLKIFNFIIGFAVCSIQIIKARGIEPKQEITFGEEVKGQ